MSKENVNLFQMNPINQPQKQNIKEITNNNLTINKKKIKKQEITLDFLNKTKSTKVFKGVYFESESWNYIQDLSKKTGINKSDIINKMIYFVKSQDK